MSAAVRSTPDRRRADEWALALASAGIDSQIGPGSDGYVVSVAEHARDRAHAVLDAFEEENRPRRAAPEPPEPIASRGAVVLAVLLCAFFVVTGPRDAGSAWFATGAAVASRIAAGELWRCVTALTLHADFVHVLGNALTLIIFGTALCAALGTGVAVWLMLIAGAAGNWLSAVVHGAPYGAVGASTGIFGAIGGLATLQLLRRRQGVRTSAWRTWAPIAAGLGLLGFLGTSPDADLLAHIFGFGFGALLGMVAARLEAYRSRITLQLGLSGAAVIVVLSCWLVARA